MMAASPASTPPAMSSTTPRSIDLNCDLGEGCGQDAAIMPFISSANIACGAHAGDLDSMRATLELCARFGVAAGAHPGHADREHFGRRALDLAPEAVIALVREQIETLAELAAACGLRLRHVKPHGALYNQAAADAELADAIACAAHSIDPGLILVGLADSALTEAGLRHGLRVAHEAFVDRRYLGNGHLAPRGMSGAVIEEAEPALAQALALANGEAIESIDGQRIRIRADSLCLHGDGSHAAEFAALVRKHLEQAGLRIQAPPCA